jgi:hypothetical protein
MHTPALNLIQLIKLLEGIRRRPTGIKTKWIVEKPSIAWKEQLHYYKNPPYPDKNNLNENQLTRHLSWHIYPSSFKDKLQHIQSSMHLKSCRAANRILPVPSFQLHTTHKSTRTHWSQSYEDIARGQNWQQKKWISNKRSVCWLKEEHMNENLNTGSAYRQHFYYSCFRRH